MNYIRVVAYIAGGDAALLLDRYESSFARSVVSNSDSSNCSDCEFKLKARKNAK